MSSLKQLYHVVSSQLLAPQTPSFIITFAMSLGLDFGDLLVIVGAIVGTILGSLFGSFLGVRGSI